MHTDTLVEFEKLVGARMIAFMRHREACNPGCQIVGCDSSYAEAWWHEQEKASELFMELWLALRKLETLESGELLHRGGER